MYKLLLCGGFLSIDFPLCKTSAVSFHTPVPNAKFVPAVDEPAHGPVSG